jgi:hypothetical protein
MKVVSQLLKADFVTFSEILSIYGTVKEDVTKPFVCGTTELISVSGT